MCDSLVLLGSPENLDRLGLARTIEDTDTIPQDMQERGQVLPDMTRTPHLY
jgi:hypothetical protein